MAARRTTAEAERVQALLQELAEHLDEEGLVVIGTSGEAVAGWGRQERCGEGARRAAELHALMLGRIVGQLGASLAHELNQPLAAASAFLAGGRARLDGDPDPELFAYVTSRVERETDRAADIVRRMRHLFASRTSEPESNDLSAAVRRTWAAVSLEAAGLGVEASLALTDGLHVVMHREGLRLVLAVLFRHALDALARTQGPRRLRIHATATEAGEIVLEVADNGAAPSEELEDRLFERWTDGLSAPYSLGLLACRAQLEIHGGSIAYHRTSQEQTFAVRWDGLRRSNPGEGLHG